MSDSHPGDSEQTKKNMVSMVAIFWNIWVWILSCLSLRDSLSVHRDEKINNTDPMFQQTSQSPTFKRLILTQVECPMPDALRPKVSMGFVCCFVLFCFPDLGLTYIVRVFGNETQMLTRNSFFFFIYPSLTRLKVVMCSNYPHLVAPAV